MKLRSCYRFCAIAAVALLLLACETIAEPPSASVAAAPSAAPETALPTATEVSLTFGRGACLGSCPVYQIEVTPTGEYQLVGAALPATLPGKLDASILTELQSLYRQVRALELPEKLTGTGACPRFMTDMPTISMSWQSTQLRWQLKHNLGCKGFSGEASLLQLEAQIEKLLPNPITGSER